ncbi:hypothetical protein P148_SR1C00001G0213 [candidate division SR1 bacterium RAAC1_SR1_1]|nr:hypothetical protein P148_SR1C00001G0213 [candidate division SR1 bacterium RAAC1_SR1_1]
MTDLWLGASQNGNLLRTIIKSNYESILIIFVIIFIFWYIKENIKARIRGEKAKDVIEWYMTNKKQSEINDKDINL